MKLQTKWDLGYTAYVMEKNKICKGEIVEARVSIYNVSELHTSNVIEWVFTIKLADSNTVTVLEEFMFSTKEEILESL